MENEPDLEFGHQRSANPPGLQLPAKILPCYARFTTVKEEDIALGRGINPNPLQIRQERRTVLRVLTVLTEARNVPPQGVEAAGRRYAGLAHCAAQQLARLPGPGNEGLAPAQKRANRRTQPL